MLLYNRNFFHPFLPSPTPIFTATHNLLSQFAIALGMSGYRVLSKREIKLLSLLGMGQGDRGGFCRSSLGNVGPWLCVPFSPFY